MIRAACFCNSSFSSSLLFAKSSARPPRVVFCTLRRWSCWTVLSFSCSMLPVCVILNCVNSASKFPTVFRKVANVFNLLGVRERGSICSDIRRVSVVPLSTLDVSVMSEISLSCTTSSLVVMSLSSSASQPSHFVKKFDKPLRNKEMFFELKGYLKTQDCLRLIVAPEIRLGSTRRISSLESLFDQ